MLIVDNLCLSVEDRDLRLLFAPFGNVLRAQVARTRMGESLRFGYVEMEKEDQAYLATTALDGAMFQSFRLHVSDASHDGLTSPTGNSPGDFPERNVRQVERQAVRMLIRRSAITLLTVILMASAHSCANGPSFRFINPLPDGKAMVYVFRPTHDFADWQSQAVYINDRKIASLSPSACTAYTTAPGILNVKIRGLREAYVSFEVEGGKSYLLRSSVNKISSGSAATGIDVLSFMDDETGLQDLRNCQPPSDTAALSPY